MDHAPPSVLAAKILPEIEGELSKINAYRDNVSAYEGGQGYWDDFCLAYFLEGVCARFIAFPVCHLP